VSYSGGGGLGWSPVGAMWRPPLVVRPSPPQWLNTNRFRRSLNGYTTDATNSLLGGMLVKWFEVATDLLVGSFITGTDAYYDLPIYADGTYYAWIWKSGTPNVFGGSDVVSAV
jgi:hypothetical protein